ncbi:MAG: ABC transporter permease, partial [Nitrososphaeria archaeon]|nr:ABC transporter permease [Nitrososphaeria archaeon]
MVNALTTLIIKEIKELLRDPKILVGTVLMPLIMFGILGSIFNISMSSARESFESISIIVVDEDNGWVSSAFKNFIENFSATKVNAFYVQNLNIALEELKRTNASGIIVLPKDLSQNISKGVRGEIFSYVSLNTLSIMEQGKAATFQSLVEAFNKILSLQIISSKIPSMDPSFVSNPIAGGYYTYFRGNVVNISPQTITGTLYLQMMMMPIVIMIMLFSAMTMASTAIALEKETKTLETLLTLPVNRLIILVGKLSGSLFVAVLGTVAYLFGFNYYMSSLTGGFVEQQNIDLSALGITITPLGYTLMGIVFFISIVATLALAVSFSVFSEDVRSAQTSISYIYIIILVPTLILMFIDINTLPMISQILIYLIPFTHTLVATKNILIGDYTLLPLNIGYLTIFTVAILYVAAKLFTTEKIFTTKISFKRK